MADLKRIYGYPDDIRADMREETLVGISRCFPIEANHYTLVLKNIWADENKGAGSGGEGLKAEKEAILRSKSMTYPVKAHLVLVSKATGKPVDEEDDYTVAQIFSVTSKHTMVYGGNNYLAANQLQLLPGVYTRSKNDGMLETHFNTGTGNSFSLNLDPEKGIFYITPQGTSAKTVLLPFLQLMGVQNLEAIFGKSLLEKNIEASKGKEESSIRALYTYLVPKRQQIPGIGTTQIREMLPTLMNGFELNKKTTELTLGTSHAHVTASALGAAVAKLIAVYRGEKEEDNRDSLAFKRVQSLPDFVRVQFAKGTAPKDIVRKVTARLNTIPNPTIRQVLPTNVFSKPFHDFLLTSSLTYTPTETNMLESIENVGKVTLLGEGGISSEEGVPASARGLDPSHFGILDLNRTPESSHAGIDLRFSTHARRDKDGNLYVRVKDKKGAETFISAQDVLKHVVGFPDNEDGPIVRANVRGKIGEVPRKDVDYWYSAPTDFYSLTTNLIPFMNSDHPNRLTMAGKALPQALALANAEVQNVQTLDDRGHSYSTMVGGIMAFKARKPGVVTAVSKDEIRIDNDDGTKAVLGLVKNLPFNQKGFMDAGEAKVKVGDRVKPQQVLADTNYTKEGDLALGLNMDVAYMPYKGYNFEDGIVISQSAAERLTSSHSYVEKYEKSAATVANKGWLSRYFPSKFTVDQLANLDEHGFAKEGVVLKPGDPVIAVLEKRPVSPEDKLLGRLHKTLIKPYRLVEILWSHDVPGRIVDVFSQGKTVKISIRAEKGVEIGDKLTGLHGNKGVVTLILPDHQMPYSEASGRKAEVLLNPASVTSRINLGQLLETAAGKIAQKTGKPYYVSNFRDKDNLKKVQGDLKAHGVQVNESMIDPETGKPFPSSVYFGSQYILKLSKTTDSNYSARNIGSYDQNKQPTKGGEEGAKGVGFMEFLALLGSDARHNLREIGTTKSEENSDYWTKFIRNEPLPKPKTTFATQKFLGMLNASGAKVDIGDHALAISPLLDKDILAQSHGQITKPLMISAKDMNPEKGGLFDPVLTGGLRGDKWTHYHLAEPTLNPLFEKATQKILGISSVVFNKLISGEYKVIAQGSKVEIVDGEGKVIKITTKEKMEEVEDEEEELEKESAASDPVEYVGGEAIKKLLDRPVKTLAQNAMEEYKITKSKDLKKKALSKLRYLHGLKKMGFDKPSDAYMLHHVPVIPSQYRTILVKNNGNLEYGAVNHLLRDHMLVNDSLKSLRHDLPAELLTKERTDLYQGLKSIVGLGKPISPSSQQRGLTGTLEQLSGTTGPKHGFFHKKVLSKKQDFSGRLTLTEDANLGLNEASIPEDMAWAMWKHHGMKDLVGKGYTYAEADKAWVDRTSAAKVSLDKSIENVPLIANRAPSLLRSNLMAFHVKPGPVNTLSINPAIVKGFAADFDGDALSVFVPHTPEAIQEAKEKLLPQYNIADIRKGRGNVLFSPAHEAILGSVYLTEQNPDKKVMKFKTEKDVLAALHSGQIEPDQPVEVAEEA